MNKSESAIKTCEEHGTPFNGDGQCFWCEVDAGNIPAPSGPNALKLTLSPEWYERNAAAEEEYIREQQGKSRNENKYCRVCKQIHSIPMCKLRGQVDE